MVDPPNVCIDNAGDVGSLECDVCRLQSPRERRAHYQVNVTLRCGSTKR